MSNRLKRGRVGTGRWRVVKRSGYSALAAGGAAVIAASMLAGIALGSHRHTYAAYSDFSDVRGAATAGVWTPDPPALCGDLSKYSAIVYGTDGDDTINGDRGASRVVSLKHGGNREIIMGLGGDDDLSGANGKDCIVGGDGNDMLHGDNGKDILLGDAGDDQLLGSNGPDLLDGGPGTDLCVGGRAPDRFSNCEHAVMDVTNLKQALTVTSSSSSAPDPAPSASSPDGSVTKPASDSTTSPNPSDSAGGTGTIAAPPNAAPSDSATA